MSQKTQKLKLDDRTLKALKPAEKGERYEIMDTVLPGLGVRVTSKRDKATGKAARRTFFLLARYPGSQNPTRRALGVYKALTLAEARDKARLWLDKIQRGLDPAEEARQEQEQARLALEAEAAKEKFTFGAVMDEYIMSAIRKQRRAKITEREIRRELIPVLGHKPLTEVTRRDVVRLVKAITKRPSPGTAHLVFGHIRTFYIWCIDTWADENDVVLDVSPCDRLKPKSLIGKKIPRKRFLNNNEIFAAWRAATKTRYPFGPFYQMLILTGQRLSDVSDARWREFDLPNKRWVIPGVRFKNGEQHIVPLSDKAINVLESMPRLSRGDFIFSTTYGEKPVSGFSKAKRLLNRNILRTLKAAARKRDGAIAGRTVELEPFVNHDLRRTVRTGLSSLRVTDHVAEKVIGHGRTGIEGVYDQHSYEDEMREALDMWADRLRDIVTPPPENVVKLESVRA